MKKSRAVLWVIVLLLSITGIALYVMAPANEEELPHRLNGLFRELHGAIAAVAIFMFGYFFSDHVKKKLVKYRNSKSNRPWDGYLHLCTWTLLIVSGLLLYYPQEFFELIPFSITSLHWYAGVVLMGLFPLHFWRKSIKPIHTSN